VTARADRPLPASLLPPPSRARWIAAGLLMVYGFAKLNGSQFTVLDSDLTKPMGDVSGTHYNSHVSVVGSPRVQRAAAGQRSFTFHSFFSLTTRSPGTFVPW
jgi:hypothetical protein